MTQAEASFSQELLEQLIPVARKPVSDVTIGMLAPTIDAIGRAKLKMALQQCWAQCSQRIDHRGFTEDTVEVSYGQMTHYLSKAAFNEFERQKKLYNQYYTVGLKQSVDSFAHVKKTIAAQSHYGVSGWRLPSSDISDFRRGSERLLLVSQVILIGSDRKTQLAVKTSNISKGGCLLLVEPNLVGDLLLLDHVTVEFIELTKQFALEQPVVKYQIMDIMPAPDFHRLALRRTDEGDSSEFDQLVERLMNEHKRRNRINVDNTVDALSARCFNMATVAQLNTLVVMSHFNNRYHLLVTQGQTLGLQGELLLSPFVLPHMIEKTMAGSVQLFFVWASSQSLVFIADLDSLNHDNIEATLASWNAAAWHKAFVVKANAIDNKMADLGTSIASDVSSAAQKLNADLPIKVKKFSEELGKISLIEDLTYAFDGIVSTSQKPSRDHARLDIFCVSTSVGRLRHMPFNVKEMPIFSETYRFTHDCDLYVGNLAFKIINGYTDNYQAVLSILLVCDNLHKGSKLSVCWYLNNTRYSLDAKLIEYDTVNKRLSLGWTGTSQVVNQTFHELIKHKALEPAFVEDVQAHKLDVAIRNLVLSNLAKVSIFAQTKKQAITLTALTGYRHLPKRFVDSADRVKLDAIFTDKILQKLVSSGDRYKQIIFVALDGSKIVERRLISDFGSVKLMLKVLQHLATTTQLYIFALDVSNARPSPEDEVINLETKYLRHYSPGKAKKLENSLNFNLSIQLLDISEMFIRFINIHK